LDQHNAFKSLAAQRGSARDGSHSRTFDRREEADQEEEPHDENRHKRAWEPNPKEFAPSKKRVANESLYPWVTMDTIVGRTLSDNLELTHKLVLNCTTDLKNAKWSLLSARVLPEFLDGEWNNVLSGKSVFSGLLSTATDNYTVENLGEFQLLFRASKPSKMIETHGDWITA
jgi:hypothetical protein